MCVRHVHRVVENVLPAAKDHMVLNANQLALIVLDLSAIRLESAQLSVLQVGQEVIVKPLVPKLAPVTRSA
jgi:hypothetical protein